MNQETITNLVTIGVAVIALTGVIYSARHVKEFDNIEKLINAIEELKNMQDDKESANDKLANSIAALEERLAVETRKIRPLPRFLDLLFAFLMLVTITACNFITHPIWGFIVAVVAVFLFFLTLWSIPRAG